MPVANPIFQIQGVGFCCLGFRVWGLGFQLKVGGNLNLRWTPHPVTVARRDTEDDIRVQLISYYTTITGWGSS